MSHNQPPPQPSPYGGGAPGPYGQGGAAGQPGHGAPQQPPGPPGVPGQAPPPQQYGYPQAAPQPGPYGGPPQQQPGPYGQQPQQPGPYGQPQQPNPYGQQPQPPYGQMPGPYGQQPPYGMPPQPPQGGGGKGKTIGIVIGAVVAVAAVVGGVILFSGPGDDGPHKLTTPSTVAQEYERQGEGQDDSGMSADDKESLQALPGVKDPHPVQAEYQTSGKKQMQLTGVWGEVEKPEQVIDAMFTVLQKAAEDEGNVEVSGSPQKFEPDDLGSAVMKCQKFKTTNDDPDAPVKTAEIPVCIWGDSSTVGGVIVIDPLAVLAGKADLDAVAETAAKVRNDARVKIEK